VQEARRQGIVCCPWDVLSLAVSQQTKAGFGKAAGRGAWLLLRNHNSAPDVSERSVFKWLLLQGSAPSCAAGVDAEPRLLQRVRVSPGHPRGKTLQRLLPSMESVCWVFPGDCVVLREAILFLLQPCRAGSFSFARPGWLLSRAKEAGLASCSARIKWECTGSCTLQGITRGRAGDERGCSPLCQCSG